METAWYCWSQAAECDDATSMGRLGEETCMWQVVTIRADRLLSDAFHLPVSKRQHSRFDSSHWSISTVKNLWLLKLRMSYTQKRLALVDPPPGIICQVHAATPCDIIAADQKAASAPTGTLLSDRRSHRSITSYITFWFGLGARFQLTGTCERALTVLTHIFPSLPPAVHLLFPAFAPTLFCFLSPFRRAVM